MTQEILNHLKDKLEDSKQLKNEFIAEAHRWIESKDSSRELLQRGRQYLDLAKAQALQIRSRFFRS